MDLSTQTGMVQDIDRLNDLYETLSPPERIARLYEDFPSGQVLLTSSFATNSAFLLHLFATASESRQIVHFIDTTYHFPETLQYKELLTREFNLTVVDVRPEAWKNDFTRTDETWKKDPDFCCQVNKVEPLNALRENFQVWASGLMKVQNEHRKNLRVFEKKGDQLRFYPIIDVTPKQRDAYIREHELPFHPMVEKGYGSVGCHHCTVKGQGREGRWVGLAKTECGLHI